MKKIISVIGSIILIAVLIIAMREVKRNGLFTPFVHWSPFAYGNLNVKPGYLYICQNKSTVYDIYSHYYEVKLQGMNFLYIDYDEKTKETLAEIKNIPIYLPSDETEIFFFQGEAYIDETLIDKELLINATNSKPNIDNEYSAYWFFPFKDSYDYNNFYKTLNIVFRTPETYFSINHELIDTETYNEIVNSKVGDKKPSMQSYSETYIIDNFENLGEFGDFEERYLISSKFDEETFKYLTHANLPQIEIYEFVKLDKSVNIIDTSPPEKNSYEEQTDYMTDMSDIYNRTKELTYYMRTIRISNIGSENVGTVLDSHEASEKLALEKSKKYIIELSENLKKYN